MIKYLLPATWLRWIDDNREVLMVLGIAAAGLLTAFILGAWIF
jgi:hypothetical protein